MTTEKDETFTVLVKGKPLATVKAHLIHAFLSVSIIFLTFLNISWITLQEINWAMWYLLKMAELSHSVISPMSFRVEYKRNGTGPAMFQRHVRFQVDISAICKQGDVADMLFAITFTLLSGNIRRFRRICEHIQVFCSDFPDNHHMNHQLKSQSQVCSKRFPMPSSPPGPSTVSQAVSESSSCGSDSSERLCYKRQVSPQLTIQSQFRAIVPHGKVIKFLQIENELENETIFDMKTSTGRRSSASTNNNNTTTPGDPGSPKTVRSKWVIMLIFQDIG